jgi:hypothetical protein
MRFSRAVGLGAVLWAAWAMGGQGKTPPAKPSTATGAEAPKKVERLVVIQDKAPLLFGNEIIGELAEGTRLQLVQQVAREGATWSLVRATFDKNWFQGWINGAMTVPDSLADVEVKLAPAKRHYVYENQTLPGTLFLEVQVKFVPTPKSPSRLYFNFADEASADLYLTHGKDRKALPYGFWRPRPGSKRREVFDQKERQQVLLVKAGEPLAETYVFAVPLNAQDFYLVLKEKTLRVDARTR